MPASGIKKQKKFGHRRHIAKPRASLSSIEKEKRQSSLTQLDFVSTPHTSTEIISIPSSYEDEHDFAVEQPRKKRRVSGGDDDNGDDDWTPKSRAISNARRRSTKIKQEHELEKGQQTMTQMDFVPSSFGRRTIDDIVDDSEDEDDLDHEPARRVVPDVSRESETKRRLPWLGHIDDGLVNKSASRRAVSPAKESSRLSPRKEDSALQELALHRIATHDFTTPKKSARHLEIPSSQTPPSIKMSPTHSQRSERRLNPEQSPSKLKTMRRSPLKEKSTNIPPPRWQQESQESQNPTMKMLQEVRMRTKMGKAPLHEEAPMPPPRRPHRPVLVEATQASEQSAPKPASPRKLKRTTTIQDSQVSDENIMTQAPPPALHRTLTVQDSQQEDLDLSSQLYRSLSDRENIKDSQAYNETHDDHDYDDPGPHTFDPVSAALDRDAARYAWTQTQAPRTQHSKTLIADSEAESDEEETYEDDLDRGIGPASDHEDEDEVIMLPNPIEGPSQELCSDDPPAPISEQDKTPMQPPPLAQKSHSNSRSPPSSPPLPRPSQASTAMPTQSSPHRIFASKQDAVQQEGNQSPPSSPRRPFSPVGKPLPETQALTISSSPLPLPPWNSSGDAGSRFYAQQKREEGREEPESLVDFSLPPPPPLGMTSSPWR